MGQEWLTKIVELLSRAGIASGEEYASAPVQAVSQPVAAVGLRDLDWAGGKATVCVRILSPRTGGGWACQTTAAKAVSVLEENGVRSRMAQMEYLPGCDCFEVGITGVMQVREIPEPPVLPPEKPAQAGWKVQIGAEQLRHVTQFGESRDLDRRSLGAHGQGTPAGITPGCGGWEIRVVQVLPDGEPEQTVDAEPFECQVSRGMLIWKYTGCVWNEIRRTYGDGTLTVERVGLAPERRKMLIG